MEDRRESKRARQACLNCRRKKTRCSGEKPVCAFCARLRQKCTWDRGDDSSPETGTEPPSHEPFPAMVSSGGDIGLAARVAMLESRLSFLDADSTFNVFASLSGSGEAAAEAVGFGNGEDQRPQNSLGIDDEDLPRKSRFSSLPNEAVFRSLIDVYFDKCHNQPYAYFHEAVFRQDYDAGLLPEYLLYAFAATACRFSDDEYYQGCQQEAIEAYARAAWHQIFEHSFSHTESLEFPVVRGLAMLATIDFTAERPRLGWVKLALSCRFAQALRLNEEPDPEIPLHEQEERRRTFWSVYLLDILMSTGPNRPPSFLEEDCTVRLPCHEDEFRDGLPGPPMPTLIEILENPTSPDQQKLDSFATTLLMATALARFIRFSLKRTINRPRALWDTRSKYYEVHSILLQFESHSPSTFSTLPDILRRKYTLDGSFHPQRASHAVYSEALFHLNHCLLNHPFILYRFFQTYETPIPLSFVQEALQRSKRHAESLLDLIRDVEQLGSLTHPSFYGYCTMAAGVIMRLYETHEDPDIAAAAAERTRSALNFLERKPVRWTHVGHMGTLLRLLDIDASIANILTDPVSLARKTTVPHGSMLWQLLDYAWLPQNKSSADEPGSSLPVLLRDSVQPPSVGPAPSDIQTPASAPGMLQQVHESHFLPPTYARMLGEDMGDILSEALGGHGLQSFAQATFLNGHESNNF